MLSTRGSLEIQRHKTAESERMEKHIHENSNQKRSEVALFTSDNTKLKF